MPLRDYLLLVEELMEDSFHSELMEKYQTLVLKLGNLRSYKGIQSYTNGSGSGY